MFISVPKLLCWGHIQATEVHIKWQSWRSIFLCCQHSLWGRSTWWPFGAAHTTEEPARTEQMTDTELTAASASGGMRFDLMQPQTAYWAHTDTELTAASASGGMRFDLMQSQTAWTLTCGSKDHLWGLTTDFMGPDWMLVLSVTVPKSLLAASTHLT